MTRPTTLVLAALVVLLPGATVRAGGTTAKSQPATTEVQHLQGAWTGVVVGQESAGTISIAFNGNSLHYQGQAADLQYDATFTLQEGTRPRQLRATITSAPQGKGIGTVIGAVFKIENCTLSLGGIRDGAPRILDDAEAFEDNAIFHYRLRRGEARSKADAPKREPPPSWTPWNPLQRPR
jgi:hypothetical protein